METAMVDSRKLSEVIQAEGLSVSAFARRHGLNADRLSDHIHSDTPIPFEEIRTTLDSLGLAYFDVIVDDDNTDTIRAELLSTWRVATFQRKMRTISTDDYRKIVDSVLPYFLDRYPEPKQYSPPMSGEDLQAMIALLRQEPTEVTDRAGIAGFIAECTKPDEDSEFQDSEG